MTTFHDNGWKWGRHRRDCDEDRWRKRCRRRRDDHCHDDHKRRRRGRWD